MASGRAPASAVFQSGFRGSHAALTHGSSLIQLSSSLSVCVALSEDRMFPMVFFTCHVLHRSVSVDRCGLPAST